MTTWAKSDVILKQYTAECHERQESEYSALSVTKQFFLLFSKQRSGFKEAQADWFFPTSS